MPDPKDFFISLGASLDVPIVSKLIELLTMNRETMSQENRNVIDGIVVRILLDWYKMLRTPWEDGHVIPKLPDDWEANLRKGTQ